MSNAGNNAAVQVLFDGMVAGTCTVTFLADTLATVTVGENAHAATTLNWTMYYDNVVAAITR